MDVLGVSCYFHDAAAALLRDGQLVAAVEEERFSRKKHDYGFPQNAIDFCLRAGGIPASALDYVVFFEKPFLKFERLLLTCMQSFPRTRKLFQEAMIPWLGDKVWIRHLLQKRLGLPPSRILFSEHHLSHAASAFYCLALPRGRDPHGGRRRGMDDRHHRGRARHRAHAAGGDPVPALAGAPLQRLHRVPRLRGQRGRVQGHGHGALRGAAARRPRVEADPGGGRRRLRARHELLRVPPVDGAHVQRPVRRAVRRAARPVGAVLHGRQRVPLVLRPPRPGPRGAGGAEPVLRRPRGEHPGGHRGGHPPDGAARAPPDGPAAPLHGRRRRAQQRGQRPHPPGRPVRGGVRPARGGRLGRRARRGALGLPRGARPAARDS